MFARIKTAIGISEVIGIAIPVIILVFALSGMELTKRPDSGSYIVFADSILSGDLFEKKDLNDISFGRAVRTPGYPLIVALAKLTSSDFISSLKLLHFVFGIFSIVFLSLVLKPWLPPIATGLSIVFVDICMGVYFGNIMTEWVAFNLLLVLVGLVVIGFRNPSNRNLCIIGLLASCIVLVRPAAIPVMLILPMLVIYRRSLGIKDAILFVSTLLPLIAWMSFNLYHLDSFALGRVSGHNIFGIGTMIGYAEEEPGDSDELREFIRGVNAKKTPAVGDEDEFVANFDKEYHTIRLTSNLFWIAYPLRIEGMGAIPFDEQYLAVYGRRAINDHLDNYISYVLHGLKLSVQFVSPYLTLYLLLIPLFALYRNRNAVLAWVALVMFAIHAGQVILISVFQTIFVRYLELTFYPYVGAIILCFLALLFAEGIPERLLGWLPQRLRSVVGPLIRVG